MKPGTGNSKNVHITFVTGCLEPGKDGVGDYTRQLALECARQGATCSLIALNDPYLHGTVSSEAYCLRLPMTLDWQQRVQGARAFLAGVQPDWLSFQFVPYAFHPKGIVFGIEPYLRRLSTALQVHVMFHELWIGAFREANLKERLVGTVQRSAVRNLVRSLRPASIHTSNPIYHRLLARDGISAAVLPLFGNVPIAGRQGFGWCDLELERQGLSLEARRRSWLFGFFGSLRPEWPPEPLFTQLEKAGHRQGREIVVLSIGRLGPGEALWQQLNARYGAKFRFIHLGEQPVERISEYLQSLDFGIAVTPYQLIGKSATVVAMFEHGLPVIVNRDDVHFPGGEEMSLTEEPLLYQLDDRLDKFLASAVRDAAPGPRLPEIGRRFLGTLNGISGTVGSSAGQRGL